jgi:septal ring-binding cell division protein DamX
MGTASAVAEVIAECITTTITTTPTTTTPTTTTSFPTPPTIPCEDIPFRGTPPQTPQWPAFSGNSPIQGEGQHLGTARRSTILRWYNQPMGANLNVKNHCN